MDLVPFAAETSHVPFYILGGLLAAWAVVLAGFGLSKSDFPKAGAQMSGVIAVSVILFVAAVGAAIVTGSTPNEKLTADEKPTPSGVKLPPPAAATPTTAVAAPAAGGGGGAASAAAGKQVFVSNGCGACHTLKEAGTSGAVGPNLDKAKPSQAIVIARVTNGAGAMPSFKGRISAADLKALAAYLVQATGGAAASGGGSTGGTPAGGGGSAPAASAAGKQAFASNCGSCHTLAAAGTSGAVGPNLDQLKPSAAVVLNKVTNGGGGMPAFKGQLSPAQIKLIAAYVAQSAGK